MNETKFNARPKLNFFFELKRKTHQADKAHGTRHPDMPCNIYIQVVVVVVIIFIFFPL